MSKIRILYLHPVSTFGGASKSLVELWKALRNKEISALVLCPAGSAAVEFARAGMTVTTCVGLPQLDNSRYGAYRGARWLVMLRELLLGPIGVWSLWRMREHGPFDVVHINEIMLLPLGLIARKLLGSPLIVHVRSLQRTPDRGLRTRLVNRWLRSADAVVAIDRTVRRTLPTDLSVEVVHNGVVPPSDCENSRSNAGNRGPFRVAMVGSLLAAKGVYEFIEAARICRDRSLDIEFIVAGENVRQLRGIRRLILASLNLARDVRGELDQLVQTYELQDRVKFLGFVGNVGDLYRSIHLLCFPSHLDAAGRPVFEAAFYGVPSLVAALNPEPDTIIHNETGLCIPARDPEAIARSVESLVRDPATLERLGANARRLASENFDMSRNAEHILRLYRRLAKLHLSAVDR